jgi:hypothetical protein
MDSKTESAARMLLKRKTEKVGRLKKGVSYALF